jgi:hypothetical protein
MPLYKRRDALRGFLNAQITLLKNNKSPNSDILTPLLQHAAEGLRALDYGEVYGMFAPDNKTGGYTLRKLRMQALGFADLLIKKKYKGSLPVIRTVAGAYGEKADVFRKWRNRSKLLGKTTDPLMKSFRTEISTRRDWDEARTLAELEKVGETYKQRKKDHLLKKHK